MSNRELAMQLIDNLSEYKLGYVVAYLQGINADEIADDTFCDQLLENYENSNEKGDFVSLEEAAKMCGVDINAVQVIEIGNRGEIYK